MLKKYPISVIIISICVLLTVGNGGVSASITSPLTVYSSNRHYLVNNGAPVVILGSGQPLPGHKTFNYRADLDDLAAHKVNYVRFWLLLVWSSENAYMPWARDGGGTANDGLSKYNLTHWDANFWTRVKDACAYAQSKDIYVNIMLFDECGIEAGSDRWYRHPFNPANNINGLSLPSTDGVPEMYSLTNSKLKSLQELYVDKLISETSSYPNVIYEICNEYTGPWDWEKHWIDFVAARCSNIISVNRLGAFPSQYWTDSNVDMVKYHWSTLYASTTNSNMVANYSRNKPINYDETPELPTITYIDYRRMAWAAFVGGGHIHLENGENPGAGNDAILYLRGFIQSNGVRFWEMAPNNSLVTRSPGGNAYTLAKPGSEYVVYINGSGGGSMTMNLDSSKTYTAKAYNPSNGAYTNLSVSGTTISGIPSYSQDMVVYVKANSPTATAPPNISLTLAVDKTSASPGETLTYTLTYKNIGAGNAKSVAISVPVPANTTYVSGSASTAGAYDSSAVKWNISSISPGGTGTLTFRVTIN